MAGELRRIAEAARALPAQFVESSADDIAEAATERLELDTGGDFSLSHAPAPLSVEVDTSGGGSSATAKVSAEGGAQWTWLEQGTQPHQIGETWLHPGAAGKQTWSDPTGRELRRLPSKAEEAFSRIMEG